MTLHKQFVRGKQLVVLLGLAAFAGGCGTAGNREKQVTIVLSSLNFSSSLSQSRSAILADFTRDTGIEVKVLPFGPDDMGARRYQHLTWLEQQSSTPDVYESDIVDIGTLAKYMIDLTPYLQDDDRQHMPAITKNYVFDGRIVALPAMTDVGLLFYRTDLLKKYGYAHPPQTWDELGKMAARIQAGERAAGTRDFWGFVWEGAVANEGLMYTALEWQASSGGGQIIEPDGTISVNNPWAVAALRRAAKWVGTISPPAVTAYQQQDIANAWEAGHVAFMRSWPYYYSVGQSANSTSRGKFDVAPLPSGGTGSAGTLGGWQLSVSKYSTHPKEAVALVRYLTSSQAQLRLARQFSSMPTRVALYSDSELLRINPYFGWLKDDFPRMVVARPSTVTGKNYLIVSEAYKQAVHSILMGKADPGKELADLEKKIVAITGLPVRRPTAPLSFSSDPLFSNSELKAVAREPGKATRPGIEPNPRDSRNK